MIGIKGATMVEGAMARRNSVSIVKQDYHHRDLKRALAVAAYRLIEREGAAAFTWASACEAVGVSIAAPYRHYADKNELFSAVALMAFDDLDAFLVEARETAGRSPRARALSAVDGYMRFAREKPHLLTLLFGPDVDFAPGGPLADKGAAIATRLAEDIKTAAKCPPEVAAARARNVWLLLHGAATLAINGQLRMPNSDWIGVEEIRVAAASLMG